MNGKLAGQVVITSEIRAHAVKIVELEQMLGASSAKDTARLVPRFGQMARLNARALKASVVPADSLHVVCDKQGTLSLQVGVKQVLSGSVQLRD